MIGRDPKIIDSSNIELPTTSIIHYLGLGYTGWYPEEIDIAPYVDSYYMGHVSTLTKTQGNPKPLRSQILRRAQHQLRRPIPTVGRSRAVFLNYVCLNRIQYNKNALGVWKTRNTIYTLIDKINDVAKETTRTQYILLDAPKSDTSASEYTRYAKMKDAQLNKVLKSHSEFVAVELHKWLIGLPSVFSMLPFGDSEIVLVWRDRGKHVIISLNYIADIVAEDTPEVFGISKPKVSSGVMEHVVSDTLSFLHNNITPVVGEVPESVFKDEDTLDKIEKSMDVKIDDVIKDRTPEDAFTNHLDKLSDQNQITAKQYKKMLRLAAKPTPNSFSNQTLHNFSKITEKDTKLTPVKYEDSDTILDPTMLENVTANYEKNYINNTMDKHTAAVIESFRAGGVIVNKHSQSVLGNITGEANVHKISVTMSDGGTSTIVNKFPKVNPDGTYIVNGVEYRQRKQKIDVPIRKTAPNTTQLLSYFGVKQYVVRSALAVDDPYKWLTKKLYDMSVDPKVDMHVVIGDVYINTNITPDDYGQCARYLDKITTSKFVISFNYAKRLDYGPDKGKSICVGKHKTLGLMYMGTDNIITTNKTVMGGIFDVLGLNEGKVPRASAYVQLAGKRVYIAMLLGFLIGMSKTLKILGVKTTIVKPRARVLDGKMAIPLSDSKIVLDDMSPTAALIMSGFLKYRTRDMTYAEMDTASAYEAILSYNDIGARQTKEYTLINDMFIDPITKDYLVSMKEPTVYIPLLIRACELLTTADHPDTADKQRIRGYERFPGAMYSEMVKSIRLARSKNNVTNRKIEQSPFAVWGRIKDDSANKITENTNPIMQLRDVESVIISGDGGRSSDTLTIDARKYHESDVGTLSESVPDNGDVGLVSFLTSNPAIKNTYGDFEDESDMKKGEMSKYFSTSYALTAGAASDDVKRVNFIGIQNQHTTAMQHMELPYVRTGYESIVPQRLSDIYSVIAPQPGKVTKLNEHGMIVTYKDSTQQGIELGVRYSRAEGAVYPNEVATNLKKGGKFKKGDALAYHTSFFEPDIWDSGRLLYKQQRMVTTVLYEGSMSYEDSCTLDASVLTDLTASGIKVKDYIVTFDQAVHAVTKIGQHVKVGDILFMLEDESTATGGFDGSVLDALKDFDKQSITSKVTGVIDRIECIYHGKVSDMSPTLSTIVKRSNLRLKKIAEATGRPYYSGEVDSEYQLKGKPLLPDTCELRVYTRLENKPANGDKFVLGLQLKCTVSDVTNGIRTASGRLVEAGFSGISVGARIVGSYYEVTLAGTLLKHLPDKLLEVFDE